MSRVLESDQIAKLSRRRGASDDSAQKLHCITVILGSRPLAEGLAGGSITCGNPGEDCE